MHTVQFLFISVILQETFHILPPLFHLVVSLQYKILNHLPPLFTTKANAQGIFFPKISQTLNNLLNLSSSFSDAITPHF